MTDNEIINQLRSKAATITSLINADNYIVYVTSTREPTAIMGAQIHRDVLPYLAEQLRSLSKTKKLALFIHTNGGDLAAPWPIISLLREYCDELQVVVIGRALSAGTLIAIAGDEIIMSPESFLSPIDPQAQVTINGQNRGIEVEDVTGYIEFAKTKVGLTGASLEKAFENLTNEIQPTVIGSLFRTHALIRSLASKILDTRKRSLDRNSEKQIVENLTEKLFSHNHLISRKEARDYVGLKDIVVFSSGRLDKDLTAFSSQVLLLLKTDETFNAQLKLAENPEYTEDLIKALLFTEKNLYIVRAKLSINQAQPGQINLNSPGWEKEE